MANQIVTQSNEQASSSLVTFLFQAGENDTAHELRAVVVADEPWFVAKDSADILGYTNTAQAVRTHCKRVKPLSSIKVLSGSTLHPHTQMIPESDLYRLVMRSSLPKAEEFQDWVVESVIPSIRKTGSYSMRQLSPAEILIQQGQMMLAIEQEQARQAAVQADLVEQVAATTRRIDQIETAADYFTVIGWHRYAKQAGSLPFDVAAQMGKRATRYCKEHEIRMGETPDPRFGTVRTYPKFVLDQLFAQTM